MGRKKSQGSFGRDWGLIGSPEKSKVQAVVGGIRTAHSGLEIGLTSQQMKNIGYGYGPVTVQVPESNILTPVEVYNGGWKGVDDEFLDNYIIISEGLANKRRLITGDPLIIHRVFDKQGRINYKCRKQKNNPFGQGWEIFTQPVEGIVAAIDVDGKDNGNLYEVGLSAMQMHNLGIIGDDYGDVVVKFNGEEISAIVYNFGGMNAIEGCGIRVSSELAKNLGLELEDIVRLYTT